MRQAGAAGFFGKVRGVKAQINDLALDLFAQLKGDMAKALDLGLMRVDLVFDEFADRLDDHLLFFAQTEMHSKLLPDGALAPVFCVPLAWIAAGSSFRPRPFRIGAASDEGAKGVEALFRHQLAGMGRDPLAGFKQGLVGQG